MNHFRIFHKLIYINSLQQKLQFLIKLKNKNICINYHHDLKQLFCYKGFILISAE